MPIEIKKNRLIFIELLQCINRPGMDKLIDYLDNSDFFTAPCSTKYHLHVDGGLCQHSLNVYRALLHIMPWFKSDLGKNRPSTDPIDYSIETIALVSLLHDVCKINTYKIDTRWRKNADNEWEQYQVYTYDEDFSYGHGEKSVFIIQQHIPLTLVEAQAINMHMGFSDERGARLCGNIFEQNQLAVMLHIADLIATYLMEGTP